MHKHVITEFEIVILVENNVELDDVTTLRHSRECGFILFNACFVYLAKTCLLTYFCFDLWGTATINP